MPIFKLVCSKCKYEMEFIKLKSTDESPMLCPECGQPLEQGVTSPSIAKLKTPAYGVL